MGGNYPDRAGPALSNLHVLPQGKCPELAPGGPVIPVGASPASVSMTMNSQPEGWTNWLGSEIRKHIQLIDLNQIFTFCHS